MRYRNIKTQAVIETACVIAGENWVVEDEKTAVQSKNRNTRKKGGEKNDVCYVRGHDSIMASYDSK